MGKNMELHKRQLIMINKEKKRKIKQQMGHKKQLQILENEKFKLFNLFIVIKYIYITIDKNNFSIFPIF